ncbi:lysoplasmalogenase family protein [Erythrobacter sp. THAF29]|uniref:lysoplasmalogenase family protein n=1 Tax=Erythrobacter sp. THAF29 TaxID=2587851 RepID=UPI00126885F8|nr:lysoplasmalogenase family protein [Erythrobacter sp. THAF29]QFT77940.1 YhhN-like protein [Erythrobacter sp. THAF29]
MAKTALVEHRPWLLASVAAAVAFYFLWNNPIGGLWLILLKGAGVGLLAAYAFYRTKGSDGTILVLALALSAAADMALEIDFVTGGALFAASHLAAIALYLRNRREKKSTSQSMLGAALLVLTPSVTYLFTSDLMVTIYSVFLGAMAATAWTSRFPRYRVGVGAVLFVLSDWLIFSRMGPIDLSLLPDLLIWPLYYAGQLMIATGVVQTLRGEHPKP